MLRPYVSRVTSCVFSRGRMKSGTTLLTAHSGEIAVLWGPNPKGPSTQ